MFPPNPFRDASQGADDDHSVTPKRGTCEKKESMEQEHGAPAASRSATRACNRNTSAAFIFFVSLCEMAVASSLSS